VNWDFSGNEYGSVTKGIIVVGTIIFWNFAIDWLEFHFPAMERLLRPAPLLLIERGQVLRRHLREELITMGRADEPPERRRRYEPNGGRASLHWARWHNQRQETGIA